METNHSFSIPKHMQEKINERWFYLYNWIWEQDVKQSIERDFLKLIEKLGAFFSMVLLIPSIILIYAQAYSIFNMYFFWVLWIINIFLIIYLVWLAIKRSSILRKNSQVLITDSSILINWRINKLNKFIYDIDLKKIWNLFEENLFKESNILKTKNKFIDHVKLQIKYWYSRIWKIWRWKNAAKAILFLWALYSIYVLSLWFIYLFWIFFIWIFWNILSFINKQILLVTGHKITVINNQFENIYNNSLELNKEKKNLSTLLSQAMKSDWKDSLLTKINSWIKNINEEAEDAIKSSIKLKKEIKDSKYKNMFNFSIYNSRIKKQIYTPLKQISDLLQNNLDKLKQNKINIEKQILNTNDKSLQWPLVASKTRTIMRIKDVEQHIKGIKIYMDKLK